MTKTQKVIFSAIAVIGIAAVIAVFLWPVHSAHTSFRETLAQTLHRPVELIELNIPPAAERYPGAVLLTPKPGQILPIRGASRPKELPSQQPIHITTTIEGAKAADWVYPLLGRTASDRNLNVEISLVNLRLFETDLNQEFKMALLDDRDVYRAEKKGLKPRVIVRTYEAKVSFKVRRARTLSADLWRNIQQKLIDAGGRIFETGVVAFESGGPMAIAYETVTVNYVATNLSNAVATEVQLQDTIASKSPVGKLNISAFGLSGGTPSVRYALMGNSQYRSDEFPNLSVVGPSIEIVESVLQNAGAQPVLKEELPYVLNESTLDNAISSVVSNLKATNTSLFVLYYVGHAVAGRGGDLHLVTNDYDGKLSEDIGDDLVLGLRQQRLDESVSPIKGSNFSDLLDVINALRADETSRINGLYPVINISKKLEEAGVPFVILIDACFEQEQMAELRASLNLTKSGNYYGPKTEGGPEEEKQYHEIVNQFGRSPHLRSSNVIIFSAAPGNLALVVPDPRPTWRTWRHVGPLALRIHRQFENAVVRSEELTWGDFLHPIVDVKELGEIRIGGTASWSDFDVVRQIPMLQELPPQ